MTTSIYFWIFHYQVLKASNQNFLVGFPSQKKAKEFMLYSICHRLGLDYDEVELAWLEHTVMPDPFWEEWDKNHP
jgi:hypothetical protein